MFGARTCERPIRLGFYLVPEFSMLAFFSAVEPLRAANHFGGGELYRWSIFTRDGAPVEASNGMRLMADGAIADAGRLPTLIVCAGFNPERYCESDVLGWLQRLARAGADLGALDTGCYLLARAGLLDGHRVTLHWENLPGFRELFPEITVGDQLFEIDGNRLTCAGGTAALDMMLHMIGLEFGDALAVQVSELFIHDRIRSPDDTQRMGLGVTQPRLTRVVAAMENHIDEPLTSAQLAATAGVSPRQLERLFHRHLGCTPRRYYLDLRLRRARALLLQTDLSVTEVAMACGFTASAHFSRSYRALFGRPPRDERGPKSL